MNKVRLLGIAFAVMVLSALAVTVPLNSTALAQKGGPSFHHLKKTRSKSDVEHVRLECDEGSPYCTEVAENIGYDGEYIGHDEPSLLFYSDVPGSGNNSIYRFKLPKEPPTLPTQDGTGGTYNFQLHPAFWFGMALCDSESFPEFTHECNPNSDTNIFDSSDPNAADYIGKHPGTAFLEVQFYPPGWVPFLQAISCDPTKWCAAVAIFGLNQDANSGVANNPDCLGTVGIEPANFAFITLNGTPHAPPSPLGATLDTFTPNPDTDLFMDSGDHLSLDIHDTTAGLEFILKDLTSGETGSMVASEANGFAQVIFDPDQNATCSERPYAYHPIYATSSEHTRVPWAAHSYNIAFADEIGHFEYCSEIDSDTGQCTASVDDPDGPDDDDFGCFDASQSLLVQIGGCIAADNDFDGTSYQNVWPGTIKNRDQDRKLHPRPIIFKSPLFRQGDAPQSINDIQPNKDLHNYKRVAFEADLPRIEAADFGGNCNRTTGENCVNPPPGAAFYPIFTTRGQSKKCSWQFGGIYLRRTQKTFGGNSQAEFGPLLLSAYPAAGGQPVFRYNNFRNVLSNNPCRNARGVNSIN